MEVSKSTFFRAFPAKEAVAIEAEAELWSTYVAALRYRKLSGVVLTELHHTLAEATAALEPGWDERYIATRRLVLTEPALLAYVAHYRTGIERQVIVYLASKLDLDPDDLRLHVLAELTTTAWSVSGRDRVRRDHREGARPSSNASTARSRRSQPACTFPRRRWPLAECHLHPNYGAPSRFR